MNLRTKVVLIASLLTLLGLVLGFSLTYWALVRFRLADLDEDNALLTQVIAEATLSVPRYEVPPMVESYLVRTSGVSAAQVYARGRLIWEGRLLDTPEPLDAAGLLEGHGARTLGSWRVYTFARDDITVQVGRRLTALQATLRPYLFVASFLSVALTLLSGVLAWFAAGVALRPLERLTHAAREFNADSDSPEIAGNDEAATLAQGFAALLTRLKTKRERERRFLAYAAHELRTPRSRRCARAWRRRAGRRRPQGSSAAPQRGALRSFTARRSDWRPLRKTSWLSPAPRPARCVLKPSTSPSW